MMTWPWSYWILILTSFMEISYSSSLFKHFKKDKATPHATPTGPSEKALIHQLEEKLNQFDEIDTSVNELASNVKYLKQGVDRLTRAARQLNGETLFPIDEIIQSANVGKNGFCMLLEHLKEDFEFQPYYTQPESNTWYKFSLRQDFDKAMVIVVEETNAYRVSLGLDAFKHYKDQSGTWKSLRKGKTDLIFLSLASDKAVPTKSIYAIRITEDADQHAICKIFRLDRVPPETITPLTPAEVRSLQSHKEAATAPLQNINTIEYDSILLSKIMKPQNIKITFDEQLFETDYLNIKSIVLNGAYKSIEDNIKYRLANRSNQGNTNILSSNSQQANQMIFGKYGFLSLNILQSSYINFHGPMDYFLSEGFLSGSGPRITFTQGKQDKLFAFIIHKQNNMIVAESNPANISGRKKCDYLIGTYDSVGGYSMLKSVHEDDTEIIIVYQKDSKQVSSKESVLIERVYVIKRNIKNADQPLEVFSLQNSAVPEDENYLTTQDEIFTVGEKLPLPLVPLKPKLDEIFMNRILKEGQKFIFRSIYSASPFQTDLLLESDATDDLIKLKQNIVNNQRINKLESNILAKQKETGLLTSPNAGEEYELLHGIDQSCLKQLGFSFIKKDEICINLMVGDALFMPIGVTYSTKFYKQGNFILLYDKGIESQCDVLVPHQNHNANFCWKSKGIGKDKNILLAFADKTQTLAAVVIVIDQPKKTEEPSYVIHPMFAEDSKGRVEARDKILNAKPEDLDDDPIQKFLAVFKNADKVTINLNELPFNKKPVHNQDALYLSDPEVVRQKYGLND